jgi:RNA 2',3'-cyclic 3'-phosphodiesterase
LRIFIGVDLDSEVRGRIARFIEGVEGFAPEARWVAPESLHVTLKFIGEQKPEQVAAIADRLRKIESVAFNIHFSGYGFFPTPKAARVFWIGIHVGEAPGDASSTSPLAKLASAVDSATAELGIPREDRLYSPHLTLARAGGRSGSPKWRKGDEPNSVFSTLDKRLREMGTLDFGTNSAPEFILYQSQLSPRGSKYAKLHRFSLGGPQNAQPYKAFGSHRTNEF